MDVPKNTVAERIRELKAQQAQQRAQKKLLTKQLRNYERTRARLKAKARQLTDDDLVHVLMMRKEKRARADENPQNNPSSSNKEGEPDAHPKQPADLIGASTFDHDVSDEGAVDDKSDGAPEK